ncbi:MAG TPA: ribonuclease III domain-containing protein, partial [Thermomicrobiales bacterium]
MGAEARRAYSGRRGAISQRTHTRRASAKRKPTLKQMEPEVALAATTLDIPFARWDLLREALIHRSYLNEDASATESNERLEFLGDAALGFIVARYLYDRYKDAPEGQ